MRSFLEDRIEELKSRIPDVKNSEELKMIQRNIDVNTEMLRLLNERV